MASPLPPGQYLTEKFPVLTVGRNPAFDLAKLDTTWQEQRHWF
jgi:hypothetical protein